MLRRNSKIEKLLIHVWCNVPRLMVKYDKIVYKNMENKIQMNVKETSNRNMNET